jgi:2-phospho-L-lactate/phosphoenolpyruvate guanylyltransferase
MLMAVIPAKSLDRAKQRLARALPPAARRDLVCRMLEQALDALAGAGIARRVVATRDPVLAALAAQHGAFGFDPDIEDDLNAAAAAAAAHARRQGATSLLLLAGDLPWIEPEDVVAMVDAAAGGRLVIAEAKDGGTNALLLTPPDAIPFAFATGAPSATRHAELAETRGLAPVILTRPGLARDIDLPADLAALRAEHAAYRDLALVA